MRRLEDIFEELPNYVNRIDELISILKKEGIYTFEQCDQVSRELHMPIPISVRKQLEQRLTNNEEEDWNAAKAADTKEAYQQYLDSYETGKHRTEAQECMLALCKVDDARRWKNINKYSTIELENFIKEYPDSVYINEATKLINALRIEQLMGVGIDALTNEISRIQTDRSILEPEQEIYDTIVAYLESTKITKNDLIEAIRKDHNFISGYVASKMYENGVLGSNDLVSMGIDKEFISHMLNKIEPQTFKTPEELTKIAKSYCTEVYFWGIPSSGKSCALGGILSVANGGRVAKSMQQDPDCQGYGYMTRLAQIFDEERIGTLPEGTPISSTYEMGFVLEDKKGKHHPITCIDLAGELVRVMHKSNAKEDLTETERKVLATLTNILVDNRTKNRKLHFFVIEYGAEGRLYEALQQHVLLSSAVAYINRTGIFKDDTDGLYILITKVDKANATGNELQTILKEYISKKYQGFYGLLKSICANNYINNGDVNVVPFTLGDVCFQNYCKFKGETAKNVVEILLERSYGYKLTKLQKMMDKLKG